MATEADFHKAMESLYYRTGMATGYWARRYLSSLKRHRGLAVAKRLLARTHRGTGFETLVQAQRADLSVEALVLEQHYAHLFEPTELEEARERLNQVPAHGFPKESEGPTTLGEVADSESYYEGSVCRVAVNRYERDPRARKKCIEHHGTRCSVCELDFGKRYGEIGDGFIHVHHLRPLGRLKSSYRLDPLLDLVPVCPNCHAMLHRRDPPYDIEQLRALLRPEWDVPVAPTA